MNVYMVMCGFDYEGEQVIAVYSSKEEADEHVNKIEFNKKMGIDDPETWYDYMHVSTHEVLPTHKEYERRLEMERRQREHEDHLDAMKVAEEVGRKDINNPFVEKFKNMTTEEIYNSLEEN